MTDTTPTDTINRYYAKDISEHNLLTDISRALGLESGMSRSERWKKKLREELVREHIETQKKADSPLRTFLRKLFPFGK